MDILSSLLQQTSDAQASTHDKIIWFTRYMKWLQRPRYGAEKKETVYTTRIKYTLLLFSKNPEWRDNFVNYVRDILAQISSVSQYSDTGFTNSGFLPEMISRLEEKVLPAPPLNKDMAALIYKIFPDDEYAGYVEFIDDDILQSVIELFKYETGLHLQLKKDILSASYVLSVQILNSIFLIQKELHQLKKRPEELNEFHLENLLKDQLTQQMFSVSPDVFKYLELIEADTEELYNSMHTKGINIDLVYRFQVQKRKLRRLRSLLNFLSPQHSLPVDLKLFISQLIRDAYHQKSLRSFFSENLALLTERIVQANSHVGEHYVTFTWNEFRKMWRSATGGGALTSLTVYLKFLLGKLALSGFIRGFVDSLNYSSSFLLIQIMGYTLATKQPSATAPFIAAALKKSTGEARKSMVALLRTQFIAVLGNLSFVFPICLVASWALLQLGYPIMTAREATYTFHSSNALGPAVFYAGFTGCLLFLSSIVAGWFENWVLIKQMPLRLKQNELLNKVLKPERTLKLAHFVEGNSNALAGNISLGFMLGMVPPLAVFFNLPLDVKHVTLSTGAFAASLPLVLNQGVLLGSFLNAVLGLLLIGIMNLSVAFTLAFLLAALSSKIKFRSFVRLLVSGLRMMFFKPWLLIIPEK